MNGFNLGAISCNVKKEIILQILTIIIIILFNHYLFKETLTKSFAYSFVWALTAFVLWAASNRLTSWYSCDPVISKNCEKILRDASANKCTVEFLPKTVII